MSPSCLKLRAGLTLAAFALLECSTNAGLPHPRGLLAPPAALWQAGCRHVPTLKTMQNHVWQCHQWRTDYPVCQPFSSPTYGHFGTRWRGFPEPPCTGYAPPVVAAPITAEVTSRLTPAARRD